MKKKLLSQVLIFCMALLMIPAAAWADSSWRWIGSARPYNYLPTVLAVALLIEILSIWSIIGQKNIGRVAAVVTAGNVLSFGLPYAFEFLMMFTGRAGEVKNFVDYLNHWPVYTVGIVYFIVMFAVEIPLVFALLQKVAHGRRRLLLTIGIANVATTAFAFIVEHFATRGKWI